MDADEEEAFIVAEADVVFWAEVFDEAAFVEDGFGFASDGVEFEVPDTFDECACFEVGAHLARGCEVAGEAFAEVSGFANVDDAVEAVSHDIDARFMGHVLEFLAEFGGASGIRGHGGMRPGWLTGYCGKLACGMEGGQLGKFLAGRNFQDLGEGLRSTWDGRGVRQAALEGGVDGFRVVGFNGFEFSRVSKLAEIVLFYPIY